LALLLCVLGVILLSGCSLVDFGGRRQALLDDARARGWSIAPIRAGDFTLLSVRSPHPAAASTLVVYIEGDGIAWRSRYAPSDDPTPDHPLGLRLALADPASDVVYLGRPCQYAALAPGPNCAMKYWTSHRLAREVVASLSAAIDALKAAGGERDVELVGFSGGGAAAALLAAERSDVSRLATVSADLDLAAWTRLHNVDPLSGSEDPMRVADRIARVPQHHWIGADDDIVPPMIVQGFVAKEGLPGSVVEIVKGYDHDCCWQRDWAARIAAARRELERQPIR
jgi:pimeloyl-ACP methyl ester carboxylesterase